MHCQRPSIGVSPCARGPAGLHEGRVGVNDGMCAKQPDQSVFRANSPDRRTPADLRQKGRGIDDATIRIGVEEVAGEVGVEPAKVGFIERT